MDDFTVEDLAKTSWSWAVLGGPLCKSIVHACCQRACRSPPVSTWSRSELLDTAHAFAWSSWITGRPELAWSLLEAWASQGMVVDAPSFGLLMMDAAYRKRPREEAVLLEAMQRSSAFEQFEEVFAWCCAGGLVGPAPGYAMRFDTRRCEGAGRPRGTHAKLSLLVADVRSSGARDAGAILEAVRQHAYGPGQWLKVAGGGKANLLEGALRSRPGSGSEVALEFGVFVGYTTVRMGRRAAEDWRRAALPASSAPLVLGLEVEPVHVCVGRWLVDLGGLSGSVEVWAGMARDLLLRAGDEFGARAARFCFMDHRGTKFHEDLARLEGERLLAPRALVVADNVLKPSAPLFLWIASRSPSYRTVTWALGEFVQHHVEDWMAVAEYRRPGGRAPRPPARLLRLAWDSDKWRRRSEEGGVRVSEWSAFAMHARQVFAECGLEARPWFH
uniref:Catechol O-methyltransferase n=1 Tax=Alexandrium monilatum TaxID=311494 RepID=A0A7S4R1U2_9DINO